ncbi:MAG: hypothetical protein HYT41_00075 [Candidatus Sungbacteria bacterium]|nr:hypothetical protein [Candidatus Sungbacteria bacterium]
MPDTERHLPVILYNWSPSHALVVRAGDTIALTLLAWTDSLPLIETRLLTADAITLRMKESTLPKRRGIPCFDPHEVDIQECMELAPYERLYLKQGDFLVVSACERPFVPEGHIGLVASAKSGFHDNSARYVYPGSDGSIALEYKMLRSALLKPGQHLANLSICYALEPLPPRTGGLGRQKSIIPADWR